MTPRPRDPAARCVRVFTKTVRPKKSEGAGNAGCPLHPRPRVRMVSEAHERSHHRFTGLFPAFSHAMVLTAYFVLSPATNSSCHRHWRIKVDQTRPDLISPPPAWHQQRVSGPHGFAVRSSADHLAR